MRATYKIGPAVADLHADVVRRPHRPAELPVQRVIVGKWRQNGLAKDQFSPPSMVKTKVLQNRGNALAADHVEEHESCAGRAFRAALQLRYVTRRHVQQMR